MSTRYALGLKSPCVPTSKPCVHIQYSSLSPSLCNRQVYREKQRQVGLNFSKISVIYVCELQFGTRECVSCFTTILTALNPFISWAQQPINILYFDWHTYHICQLTYCVDQHTVCQSRYIMAWNVYWYIHLDIYLHLPLTFLRWTISDQLASYTDKGQVIMWRCR